MKMSDLVRPGDKIDIKLLYQVERRKNGEDIEVKEYKSNISDCLSDNMLEINMPTESGKMVLFQTGLRCEMVVYTKKGMYKFVSIAKERYKHDNLYFLSVEVVVPPAKFQRREYFRISYVNDMKFYEIDEKIASLETTEELFCVIHNPSNKISANKAIIQDISGGGIKFLSTKKNEVDEYIVAEIRLVNDKLDENFYLVCKIISSDAVEGSSNKYTNRAKFIYKDLKDRESIVRFVFEEERRIRKKVSG